VISARSVRPGGNKGQQGQATDALNRAKQQADQQGSQPPVGDNEQWGDDIPF
ncbi:single-stranded DNA-binding protein, partial [Escherichia coli]